MGFPINATSSGRNQNALSRYLQWLLSQFGNQSVGATNALVPQPQQNVATFQPSQYAASPEPSSIDYRNGGVYGGDYGVALRTAQRNAPGSFRGSDIYAAFTPAVDPQTLMQQASSISPDRALQMLRESMNVGNYQFADMSKDFINSLANAWEKYNTMTDSDGIPISMKATYDSVSPKYDLVLTNDGYVPINPSDQKASVMAGLFNLIRTGSTAAGLLGRKDVMKMNLDDQQKDDLKSFSNEQESRNKAQAQMDAALSGLAKTYRLPDPNQTWDVPPEVVGAIWQRQKTGLTNVQAAQQEADILASRLEASKTGYVPKTRDEIRAEMMKQYASEDAARTGESTLSQEPLVKAALASKARTAAQRVIKSGGGADAAERAASAIVNAPQHDFGVAAEQSNLDAERAKAMDALIEAKVRSEGYKAMRGLKTAGDDSLREAAWRAQMNLSDVRSREQALADEFNAGVTERVGSPLLDALARAFAIQSRYSKDYRNPSGVMNQYPIDYWNR